MNLDERQKQLLGPLLPQIEEIVSVLATWTQQHPAWRFGDSEEPGADLGVAMMVHTALGALADEEHLMDLLTWGEQPPNIEDLRPLARRLCAVRDE